MEEWVHRALKRWPNVPALYGWLKLDRRGRWLIQDELISRPQIIDVINANYAADERGCWYFQNGPQRGYVQLEYAPLVLRAADGEGLFAHTGQRVERPTAAYMDETGALLIATEHGPGALIDDELEWALARMRVDGVAVTDADLAAALSLPSAAGTKVTLELGAVKVPIRRLDASDVPGHLKFVRDPLP